MTKMIKRYPLIVEPVQTIKIPKDHEILRVGNFDGAPYIWAHVGMGESDVSTEIYILADDKAVPPHLNKSYYLGSFEHKTESGAHVLHVFRR